MAVPTGPAMILGPDTSLLTSLSRMVRESWTSVTRSEPRPTSQLVWCSSRVWMARSPVAEMERRARASPVSAAMSSRPEGREEWWRTEVRASRAILSLSPALSYLHWL